MDGGASLWPIHWSIGSQNVFTSDKNTRKFHTTNEVVVVFRHGGSNSLDDRPNWGLHLSSLVFGI